MTRAHRRGIYIVKRHDLNGYRWGIEGTFIAGITRTRLGARWAARRNYSAWRRTLWPNMKREGR